MNNLVVDLRMEEIVPSRTSPSKTSINPSRLNICELIQNTNTNTQRDTTHKTGLPLTKQYNDRAVTNYMNTMYGFTAN